MDNRTYIFDNIEVRSTGRTACKPNDTGKKFMMIEIIPVNEEDGTWIRWVPFRDLYIVSNVPLLNNEKTNK